MSETSPIQAVIVPVTGFQQNCSVLWCPKTMRGEVVDPGGDLERILGAAKQHNVTIEKILITHGHIDHAGFAAELAERLDVPIEGPHPDDAFWIDMMTRQGQQFGLDGARPFQPTRWLDQGDSVSFGEVEIAVLHCPGHTPGHVVFFHAEAKLAIVGDVLFQGAMSNFAAERENNPFVSDAVLADAAG